MYELKSNLHANIGKYVVDNYGDELFNPSMAGVFVPNHHHLIIETVNLVNSNVMVMISATKSCLDRY